MNRLRLWMALCLVSLIFGSWGLQPAAAGGVEAAVNPAPAWQDETPFFNYLPVLKRNSPANNIYGVENWSLGVGSGIETVASAGASWVRLNGLVWANFEPTQGARNWDANLEQQLINAYNLGLKTILIVRGAPTWARMEPNSSCGPIRVDSQLNGFQAFAAFMRDVVARYSVPPYNVLHYELWNEPDIAVDYQTNDLANGCWGIYNDVYFGGRYYGQMLKEVYPRVKEANPRAQVLVGGLLLDCNPDVQGSCSNPAPPRFFEGILVAGEGKAYFDGVSFHAYDYYGGTLGLYTNGPWGTRSDTSGPAVVEKAAFLRKLLSNYGFPDKYLINTEGAMITANGATCDATCEDTKAIYLTELYATSHYLGLRGSVWYTLFGWRNSQLLTGGGTPLPAYNALAFARSIVPLVSTATPYTATAGVSGYQLTTSTGEVWVLWTKTSSAQTVTLPSTPVGIFTWDSATGTYQPAAITTTVSVGLAPVYVQVK